MALNIEPHNKVCRACLSTSGNMTDLFEAHINDDISLEQIFSICTRSVMYEGDGLPSVMCAMCVENLKNVYSFLQLCHESEQKFRRALWRMEPADHGVTDVKNEPLKEEIFAEEIVPLAITNKSNGNKFDSIFITLKTDVTNGGDIPSDDGNNRIQHNDCIPANLQNSNESRSLRKKCLMKERGKQNTSNKPVYQCEHCPMIAMNLKLLSEHVVCHADYKRSICDICNRTFATRSHLKYHLDQKHRIAKPHVCSECQMAFPVPRALRDHVLLKHSNGIGTSYLCSVCGSALKSKSGLRVHMSTHDKTKSYACKECPKKFHSLLRLQMHLKTHLGVKPYACDECDSRFTRGDSLRKHKRERPFPCDMCDMRFTSASVRNRHILTHTGEKPHLCNHCDRAFTQKNDLVKHLRTHVGDQIYKCSECDKGFPFHRELQEHYKIHWHRKEIKNEDRD